MPVTMLDPKTALILVDLQKGIVQIAARSAVHPVAEVVQNASALAAAFRKRGLPVVLGQCGGQGARPG